MKIIQLNEHQYTILCHEILKEANRIRRVRDDEFPYYQANPSIETLNSIKDSDEEFNKLLNLKGNQKTNRLGNLSQPLSQAQKDVDNVQNQLTKNIQQRLKAQGKSIYQDMSNVDVPNATRKKLANAGLEIEIKGKTFAYGNKKLPPSTMIINLTSAFNCPAKECPLRQSVCYAGKDEKMYTNTELRNLRNEFALEQLTVKEILQLLDVYIKSAPIKIKTIRLSESGDFKSQEVVDFCEKMAQHLNAKYGIRTVCYTHQPFNFTHCTAMIVNSSLPGETIKGADRNYLVCNKTKFNKIPEGLQYNPKTNEMTFKCYCDCYKCNFCYNTKEENGEDHNIRTNVYVQKH